MIYIRFAKNKSDLKDEVIPVIKNIQSRHPISFIRCENAGENQELDQSLDPLIITLTFEYTPRDTSQQNGVVERKYQNIYQLMRSMLNGAILANKKIHSEKTPPPQSPYQVFYVNLPKYFSGLIVFREIGILKLHIRDYSKNFKTRVL